MPKPLTRSETWYKHAHPDHTVLDAEAGDVPVHKRTPYRVVAVQPFGYKCDQWFRSVAGVRQLAAILESQPVGITRHVEQPR